jgi:hypothetical protein
LRGGFLQLTFAELTSEYNTLGLIFHARRVAVDLTSKHWLAVILVLTMAAAAGLGVPLALKVQSGASLEERIEAAKRLLQEVPLIDG